MKQSRFVRELNGMNTDNFFLLPHQITFLEQEMCQRSKTADGKTSADEDESLQEVRLIRNAIKFEEGNLVQHQAWVRGWEIVAYNEHRRSFIARGPRKDEHAAAALLAQGNAEEARSNVESTEQHLRHLKREYVRKNKLRRYDECSYQTIFGRRKSDSDAGHGGVKRQRIFGSQARERIIEHRTIGEKLAEYFLDPDEAEASSAAPAQSAAPEGFKTNGWTSVNAPALSQQQSSLPKTAASPPMQASSETESEPPSPRPSRRRGFSLDRTSQPSPTAPLQPSNLPPPHQPSPRPVITPAEGRRRIILNSPSPARGPLKPAPPPPTSLAAAHTRRSQPSAPAQTPTSSSAGLTNKRKRDTDDEVADTAAESTSQVGPSSKRVREQPAPAAALAPASVTTAAAPAPAPPTQPPTNAAPAPKYVRGGVKSKFLGEAEALASHLAPDGKTRKSTRVSKRRRG